MKIKDKLNKFYKVLTALFISFTAIVGSGNLLIKAVSYDLTEEFKPEWQHAGTTAYGDATKMWVNGDLVWCLQPNNRTLPGNQTLIDISDIGITQSQMNKISLIAYYGYRNKTRSDTNYFLTQNMIWKYLNEPGRLVSSSYPDDASWKSEYDDVMKKVNSFGDTPIFHGKTYTIDMGKTLSIDDTNKVLSELLVYSVRGGKAVISGNTLKITPDGTDNKMDIRFKRDISKEQTETNFVVRANGKDSYGRDYQAVSTCLSGSDPYSSNVKINVNLYGSIKLAKQDEANKKIPNTSFIVSKNANMSNAIGTFTTGEDGTVTADELTPGSYFIQETKVPSPLLIDKTIHKVTVNANETTSFSASNKWALGSINLEKEDIETGKKPQGEATLEGAVYGLYARNNILHPSTGAIVHPKDKEIKRLITNADAKASISNVYLGDYYLKEITPSEGYTLDPTEYEVPITYKDQNTSIVTKAQTVKERVISQAFSIVKISDNYTGEADLLKDIEFTIKSQKDIDKFGSWEKAPIAKNFQGKDASILVTDKKGYAKSDRLPFGSYVIRETKGTDEHSLVPDFTVVVDKDSSEPQSWRVLNDEKFRAVIKIEKTDIDTGKIVKLPGAEFKIKNLRTNEFVKQLVSSPYPHYVDTWTTTNDGIIYTDKMLDPGEYELIETKAPDGYTINTEPIKFEIKKNVAYETTEDGKTPVITVKQSDKAVKGQILIEKKGEVLTGAEKLKNGDYKFVYEMRRLADVEFEIYADEDIMSADKQGNIIYKKDSLVDLIITKSETIVMTKELPLGKYRIVEKQAPHGYIKPSEVKYVTLSYKDETTEVVHSKLLTIVNERQKVKVSATKLDLETQEKVSGAEISLYTNRDIYNYDQKVILAAGTLLQTITTDNNGKALFDIDLPNDLTPEYGTMPIDNQQNQIINDVNLIGDTNSLFYVTENKAPNGYDLGIKTQQYFNTAYTNETEPVLTFAFEFQNKKIRSYIDVQKVDFYDQKVILKEAGFTLYRDAKCTDPIETIKTDFKTGIARFDNLVFGDYYIKETYAPAGYKLSDKIVKVTINDDWVKGKNDTRIIIYPDKPLPEIYNVKTGDTSSLYLIITLFCISSFALCFIGKRKKNKVDE